MQRLGVRLLAIVIVVRCQKLALNVGDRVALKFGNHIKQSDLCM